MMLDTGCALQKAYLLPYFHTDVIMMDAIFALCSLFFALDFNRLNLNVLVLDV